MNLLRLYFTKRLQNIYYTSKNILLLYIRYTLSMRMYSKLHPFFTLYVYICVVLKLARNILHYTFVVLKFFLASQWICKCCNNKCSGSVCIIFYLYFVWKSKFFLAGGGSIGDRSPKKLNFLYSFPYYKPRKCCLWQPYARSY